MSGRARGGRAGGVLAAAAAVGMLGACMPASYRLAKALEGQYTLQEPGPGWLPVGPGGGDYAWHHDGMGATIYSDSNCGPRYRETRIEDLATELVIGLRDAIMDFEEYQQVAGREGIVRTHSGRLDGVPVRLAVAVVNRDACTYDFVLVAPQGKLDEAMPAWTRAMEGFRLK